MDRTGRLCQLSELRAVRALGVRDPLSDRDLIVVLPDHGRPCAYINSCPHNGTPLETFANRFLDETGQMLICSTHGARFRLGDGRCVSGPCPGASLAPVPVTIDGCWVVSRTVGE